MLFLATTTDKLQLITGAAVAVDVHCSFADNAGGTITEGKQNTAIVTATTTDILAPPGASTVRKLKLMTVRNKGAAAQTVTVVFDQNGTDFELHSETLVAGAMLQYIEGVGFQLFAPANRDVFAASTADQAIGASVTAYLTGSGLRLPSSLKAGTLLRWRVQLAKTAAATAALSWLVKFGTNGTTADTTRCTMAGDTETAVADEGVCWIDATIRGPIGASCVVQASMEFETNLTTTGFSNTARKALVRPNTSAAFDITPAGTIAGLSLTTGASHALTIRQVIAELIEPR